MAIVWNVQKLIPARYSTITSRFEAYGPLLAAGNPKWHCVYTLYDTYSMTNIWTYYWERHAIVGVNAGTDTISIFGDYTSKLGAGVRCVVTDSTGNDGVYTVSSAAYDSTNTNITMNEDVPDGTVDGYLMFDAKQQIAMVWRGGSSGYSVAAANSYSGGSVGYRKGLRG